MIMTIEEKARAYDEALKLARDYHEDKNCFEYLKGVLENIFPELAESENERIRKTQLDYWRSVGGKEWHGVPVQEVIAWLEKQSNQKPVLIFPKFRVGNEIKTPNEESLTITKIDEKGYWSEDLFICDFDEECLWDLVEKKPDIKVEPKFKNDDWVVSDYNNVAYIESISETKYNLQCIDGFHEELSIEYVDRCWHLWTIQDAKEGDVLEFGDHGRLVTGILSFVNKTTGKVDVSCLLEGDKFKVGVFYNLDTVKPYPATKEQRDLLFQKMLESGYKWDEVKKELKEIETPEECLCISTDEYNKVVNECIFGAENKSRWTEEDEAHLHSITTHLGQWIERHPNTCGADIQCENLAWLKSLKQRLQ